MDEASENLSLGDEELEGEAVYVPNYVCVKKEVPEEEVCESEKSSCSEARTTTGNILGRMIKDPKGRRPPCLGKWSAYLPKSESDFQENNHQFRAAQESTTLNQMCSLRVTSDPNFFRQPAIIATIGPSTSDVSSIMELLTEGMNIARVSMAHADPCNEADYFRSIIEASNRFQVMKDYKIPTAIMMDLKGPEIRTGKINPGLSKNYGPPEVHLKEGAFLRLTSDKVFENRCTEKMIYIDYECLYDQVCEETVIYLADGEIKIRVYQIENKNVVCVVEAGGVLKSCQKVCIPSFSIMLPAISEYDIKCLRLAVEMEVDIIVVPKTRNAETIKEVKKLLDEMQGENNILILGKISSFEGLENIDEILRVVDGIVIQKDDLSYELGPEKVFIAQKEIIGKSNRVGKPVLCTARLNSISSSDLVSSRVEFSDIGGAIVDGADGIILIAETAIGDKAEQAVSRLSKIIREAEAATMQKPFYFDLVEQQSPSIEPNRAIALAAVQIANKIQAAAILAVTTSGKTAQLLSWFRPRRPVIAISRVGKTCRQLNLWRAVLPLHFSAPILDDWFQDVKARFEYGISYGKDRGIIESGDLLVLVSGYRKKAGFTNCLRVVFAATTPNEFLDNLPSYYGSSNDNLI